MLEGHEGGLGFPDEGWMKVNTDGASKANPSRSAIGFVVRDEEGDVVFTLGKEIQEVTNTEAEALAILQELRHCVQHGYTQILLQTDSMLLKNVVEGTWCTPW